MPVRTNSTRNERKKPANAQGCALWARQKITPATARIMAPKEAKVTRAPSRRSDSHPPIGLAREPTSGPR